MLSDTEKLLLLSCYTETMFRKPRRKPQGPSSSSPSSRSVSPSKPSASSHLVPPSEFPRDRRPRHSQSMYLPGPDHLFSLLGQDYSQEPSTSRGCVPYVDEMQPTFTPSLLSPDPVEAGSNPVDDIFITENSDVDDLQHESRRLKRKKQWLTWTDEVIPSLICPYLQMLRTSQSLRSISRTQLTNPGCSCSRGIYHLKIVSVYFESEL